MYVIFGGVAQLASARVKAIEEHDRRRREAEEALLKAKLDEKKKRDANMKEGSLVISTGLYDNIKKLAAQRSRM